MKASKNPRSEWKEGHDATDSKASDSPFPRGVMRPITSGRSPGSWFPRVLEPSSPPSNLPQAQRNLSGSNERRLPTYSGGTAPASHRLPFYAPTGTQSDQQIFGCYVYRWRRTMSTRSTHLQKPIPHADVRRHASRLLARETLSKTASRLVVFKRRLNWCASKTVHRKISRKVSAELANDDGAKSQSSAKIRPDNHLGNP